MFFLKSYFSSICNINYYRVLNKKSFLRAVIYFFVLIIIVQGVSGVKKFIAFNNEFNYILEVFNDEIEEFKIENGTMSFEGEKPFLIKRENLVIVFNDSNEEVEYSEDSYLFSVEFRDKYVSYSYLTMDNENKLYYQYLFWENLNKNGFIKFANLYSVFINITTIILEVLIYIMKMFFYTFITATIATYMNYFNKIIAPFKEVYKLTLYSMTLPLTLNLILVILNLQLNYFDALFIVISLIYLLFAYNTIVNEIKGKNKEVNNNGN